MAWEISDSLDCMPNRAVKRITPNARTPNTTIHALSKYSRIPMPVDVPTYKGGKSEDMVHMSGSNHPADVHQQNQEGYGEYAHHRGLHQSKKRGDTY